MFLLNEVYRIRSIKYQRRRTDPVRRTCDLYAWNDAGEGYAWFHNGGEGDHDRRELVSFNLKESGVIAERSLKAKSQQGSNYTCRLSGLRRATNENSVERTTKEMSLLGCRLNAWTTTTTMCNPLTALSIAPVQTGLADRVPDMLGPASK